jgi:hypothetical protein
LNLGRSVAWRCVCPAPVGRQGSCPTALIRPSLVIDRFGGLGTVYRETEVERTDLETIITDLMSGQFNDPVRVVAFNTLEHWSEDVSEDIATEIQTRCDIEGVALPEHIHDFVASNIGPTWQLALRLI